MKRKILGNFFVEFIDAIDNSIDAERFYQQTYERADEYIYISQQSTGQHYHNIGNEKRSAYMHLRKFLYDECHDIRTAGAGVNVKHHSAGDSYDYRTDDSGNIRVLYQRLIKG